MHAMQYFSLGLGLTEALAFAVVWYIKSHLRAILVDLCGTEARADFWMAFTNVTLILVPMVFSMESYPEGGQGSPVVFQFIEQLKWALIGLIASVAGLGVVLRSFIRTEIARNMPKS
jgi:uncharacterized membrane protein YhaH (DUF805 family)